jgi:hypothetical protein
MVMVEITVNGQIIACNSRQFSTGSRGYHGNGKIFLEGKKYQANFMLIEVNSKPKAQEDKKKKWSCIGDGGNSIPQIYLGGAVMTVKELRINGDFPLLTKPYRDGFKRASKGQGLVCRYKSNVYKSSFYKGYFDRLEYNARRVWWTRNIRILKFRKPSSYGGKRRMQKKPGFLLRALHSGARQGKIYIIVNFHGIRDNHDAAGQILRSLNDESEGAEMDGFLLGMIIVGWICACFICWSFVAINPEDRLWVISWLNYSKRQ